MGSLKLCRLLDLLPPLSAFTVFLSLCAVGFLFLVLALAFGGIFDFLETDHDFATGGPGFFSSRVMAVFVTAFGGFGAVATYYGLAPVPAALVGFGSGIVFGGAIGVGQIRCRIGEELVDKIARTRDGMAIAENTSVQIEEVLGETVIVKKT